ncbi:SAP domain-containing protein [Arthroderma uncinatum]|uniref:SAP domain-containing protein n=1 Tax=Arthroderma uncinatum TaxID=74035 RepID=UPI00144A7673|nr:SAP domain-containing protein [Arthroderma uncinatum]KAF3481773.1 SAP domain-containing protein [Arthroderma uncinatum]
MAGSQPQPARAPPRAIECQVPVGSDLAAPAYPNGPTLFNEVEWGPFPSDENIAKAYKVWSIPNNTLTASHPSTDIPSACLARNVYESILSSSNLPIDKDKFVRQSSRDGEGRRGWLYSEIFDSEPDSAQQAQNDSAPNVLVQGHNPLIDTKYWTKARLQPELRARGVPANDLVSVLRQRLYDDELQKLQASTPNDEDKGSILPRQDLSEWGVKRSADDYMLKITSKRRLSPLDMYTWAISLSPYNPTYWTSRAYLYYQMGHFDLAIGDAYRAQLLCEKLANPLKRHMQPGLYIRIWDAIERHILQIDTKQPELSTVVELVRKGNGVNSFIPLLRKTVHHIIVLSLLAMQCWEDYAATEPYLRTRLIMADRDKIALQQREVKLAEFTRDAAREKRHNYLEYFFERHYGFITCRQYPYEPWDSVLAIEQIAERMNKDMVNESQALTYRLQHIKVDVDEYRLAVYADEDIPKGAVIYVDEPSIRGHLQRLRPSTHRCENCKRPVTPTPAVMPFEKSDADSNSTSSNPSSCECANCFRTPLYWCSTDGDSDSRGSSKQSPEPTTASSAARKGRRTRSRAQSFDTDDEQETARGTTTKRQKKNGDAASQRLSCLEIARSLYHNRVCGRNWKWLHDTMRPNRWPDGSVPRELGTLSHTNEKHGTLLSLLLREVFDITLLRRKTDNKPNLLAYEIDELMPIMQWSALTKNLPFSFAANIQVPFDILSCLGVDIFRDLTFDTWVIQLVLRKLLVSAIPWHPNDERDKDIPEAVKEKVKRTKEITKVDAKDVDEVMPTFPDLYVFPVVSIFKHACPPHHNVDWHWDTEIPNRLILHANRAIRGGEELFLRYSKVALTNDTACRLFSRPCDCPGCGRDHQTPDMNMPDDHYGDVTSSEEERPDTPPSDKPKEPHQGPNPARTSSQESSQEGAPDSNDVSEDSAEQGSDESDQAADVEDQGQEELDDYTSSSQEEPGAELFAGTHLQNPPYGEPPSNTLPGDSYLAAAQRALEQMREIGRATISAIRDGAQEPVQQQGGQQQPLAKNGSTPTHNPMPAPSLPNQSSTGNSDVPQLQIPRPPSRPGGARVRHNGVLMTSTEYNLLRMQEAVDSQPQEQEQEQQQRELQRTRRAERRRDDGGGA